MIGTNICFDPGTANLNIWVKGKGVVVSEPNIAAYDAQNGKISAIGKKAYSMLGKNHDWIDIVQPVRNGSVYDFQTMQNLLGYHIQKICGSKILKPNILVNVPAQATVVDKRNVLDLATGAGASKICIVESPLAAAIGAGVDTENYEGIMVVDIGAGTTDIAIISRGTVCVSKCVKSGGDDIDESILNFLRRERETVTGKSTAEKIKRQIGTLIPDGTELAVPVYGKDAVTGNIKTSEISSSEIRACAEGIFENISEEIRLLIESAQPEISCDVFKNGIIFTGGGSNIPGITGFFEKRLDISAVRAENAQSCTINGMAILSEKPEILERNCYVYKTRQELGYDE